MVLNLEKLADNLPKAGSLVFNEADYVATMIGKKEREDVKAIEYTKLSLDSKDGAFSTEVDGETVTFNSANEQFPEYAAGAKALLKRLGVTKTQFFGALKTLA